MSLFDVVYNGCLITHRPVFIHYWWWLLLQIMMKFGINKVDRTGTKRAFRCSFQMMDFWSKETVKFSTLCPIILRCQWIIVKELQSRVRLELWGKFVFVSSFLSLARPSFSVWPSVLVSPLSPRPSLMASWSRFFVNGSWSLGTEARLWTPLVVIVLLNNWGSRSNSETRRL